MTKDYTDSQLAEAVHQITKEFHALCQYDYAKLTVNMNRIKGRIEIVPEPHIIIDPQKKLDKVAEIC